MLGTKCRDTKCHAYEVSVIRLLAVLCFLLLLPSLLQPFAFFEPFAESNDIENAKLVFRMISSRERVRKTIRTRLKVCTKPFNHEHNRQARRNSTKSGRLHYGIRSFVSNSNRTRISRTNNAKKTNEKEDQISINTRTTTYLGVGYTTQRTLFSTNTTKKRKKVQYYLIRTN